MKVLRFDPNFKAGKEERRPAGTFRREDIKEKKSDLSFWKVYCSTGKVIQVDNLTQLVVGRERGRDKSVSKVLIKKLGISKRNDPKAQKILGRERSALRLLSWTEGVYHLIRPEVQSKQEMALEYFSGNELTEVQTNGSDRLKILLNLAKTLAKIHKADILHSGLNYASILINPKTKDVRVINFGFASSPNLSPIENDLKPQAFLQFRAPELFDSGVQDTVKSETYALGLIFYRILTGQDAYPTVLWRELVDNKSSLERRIQFARMIHQTQQPDFDRKLFRAPNRVIEAVSAMLEKKPSNRVSIKEIEKILDDHVEIVLGLNDIEEVFE